MNHHPLKALARALVVLPLLLALLAGCSSGGREPEAGGTASPGATASTPAVDEPAFDLARIERPTLTIDDPTIDDYARELDELIASCDSISRADTAGVVGGVYRELRPFDPNLTVLTVLEAMTSAIPEGSQQLVTCRDIANALVAMSLGGSVEFTPEP